MKTKSILGIAFAVAMSSVVADDTVYYLVHNEQGANTGGFTNSALWEANNGDYAGEEGEALSQNKVFGIKSKWYIDVPDMSDMPSADAVFTGKRLECGSSSGSQGSIKQRAHGETKTSWDNWGLGEGLKLYRGCYKTGKDNVTSHIYGKMEVANNSNSLTWEFYINNPGSVLHFHSDISSANVKNKNIILSSDADGGGIYFDGSLDGFYGDILTSTTDDCGKTIGFGTTTLANRLQLCTNCTLTTVSATNVFKVGKLECDKIAGIKVKIAANEEGVISAGQIVITNSVAIENGPVVISTDFIPSEMLTIAVVKPLVFAKGVNFNPDDFVWQPVGDQRFMYIPSFEREADGAVSFMLTVVPGKLVTQTTTDRTEVSITGSDGYRSSSLTNMTHWSDGSIPHSGANYLVSAGTKNSFALRTEVDAMMDRNTPFAPIDYTFRGKSLIIDNKSYFVVCCSNLTIGLLRFLDGSILSQAQFTSATLNGKVSVEGNTQWNLYSGNMMTVKSELVGDGEIRLVTAAVTSPNGQLLLDNVNDKFTGRICVSQADTIVPNFNITNQTVNIKDGRALGGAGLAFDPKALTLERYGSLCALETTTMSEPTRGTWINGIGRFKVSNGKILTYSAPLAVYGTFCKEGSGLLALGNAQPAFGETALAVTPDDAADNRTFLIREGNVKVTNAYALNGLDVVVEDPESVIVLDAETTDATLSTYGIVNTLTPGTPFAVSREATKIKIGFSCASEPTWGTKTLAICTVKKEYADAVGSLLQKVKFDGGVPLSVASITPVPVVMDSEECVTFMAKVVSRFGTVISFR